MHVAAFGKHPAWDDFMDDLGIQTPRLADLRQLLLERGVRACIDGGRWDQLEPGHALDGFAHELVSRGDGDLVIGRIWSSRDGKGRAAYPMVACAQFRGVPLAEAIRLARPALEALQSRCENVAAAGQVVDVILSVQTMLRDRIAALDPARTELKLGGEAPGLLARQQELGPARQGLHRVLYEMDRELVPFLRGPGGSRSRSGERQSRRLRVPLAIDDRAVALEAWMNLVYLRIEPWCPVTIIAPLHHRWLDVIVGELSGPELFCLRASTKVMPMASEIPYTIDAEIAVGFDRFIDGAVASPRESLHSESGGVSVSPERVARTAASGRGIVILALVLAVLLVGSLMFLIFGSRLRGTPPPPAPPPNAVPSPGAFSTPAQGPWELAVIAVVLGMADEPQDLLAQETVVSDSAALNAFWRSQMRQLRAAYGQSAPVEMRSHAFRIQQAVVALRSVPTVTPQMIDGTDAGEWVAFAGRKREQRLNQSLSRWTDTLIDPGDEATRDELAALGRELNAQTEAIVAMAHATHAARRSLAVGQIPVEFAAMIDRDPMLRDPDLRPLVVPLIERVQRVRSIERIRDVDTLLHELGPAARPEVAAAMPEPEIVVGGWRRLGALSRTILPGPLGAGDGGGRLAAMWPATAEELAIDLRLAETINRLAREQASVDPAASAALLSEVTTEQARRIKRMLMAVDDGPALSAAADALARLGVPSADLDPRVRFNLLLHGLQRSLSGELPDADAASAARQFVAAARDLPGGTAFVADAAATIRSIEETLAAPSSPAPALDPTKLGPATTGKYTGRMDGDRVHFSPVGGEPSLTFVRIDPAGSGSRESLANSFYLSTTEVSLGQFIELARAVRLDLAHILPVIDPLADGRLGPRTWEWRSVRGADPELVAASDWLSVLDVNIAAQYAPGEDPGQPSPEHPMNYLAPHAAAMAAAAVGCRLPTPAEWLLSLERLDASDEPDGYNLRDQTWARHDAHVRQAIARGRNIQSATVGSIGPTGGAATPGNDGVLWLAPVSAGGGKGSLKHLRGNVAEWLMNSPEGAVPKSGSAAAVERFVSDNRDRFFVAGGSAITDASPESARPRQVDVAEAAVGYCDVGFRLAFSAASESLRGESLADRLRTAVAAAPYLRARTR